MESLSEEIQSSDTQRQAIYDCEKEITEPIGSEELPAEVAEAVVEGIWNEVMDLPLRPPKLTCDASKSEHTYYAWKHEITLNCSPSSVPTTKLLHELAHAKLAGLGIGPFIESHGPFFVSEFGRMWAIYSGSGFYEWKKRCASRNLRFAQREPDLSGHLWAVVEEGGRQYAVRPSTRAVEIGWNVVQQFPTSEIEKHHPMA